MGVGKVISAVLMAASVGARGAPGASGAAAAAAPRDSVTVAGRKLFTDAPIRYAPVTWQGRTYVGSDDGHLYCLDHRGELVWKFFGGYSNRKLLMAGRLASCWHVSSRPVAHDGKVYFTAGTFPFMGVFVYALDAATGKVEWINDSSNDVWVHAGASRLWEGSKPGWRENSFVSVTPKGALSVRGNALVVQCGRARVPAQFDLRTGALMRLHQTGSRGGRKDYEPGDFYRRPDYDAIALKTRGCFPPDKAAGEIIKAAGVTEGYCVVLGVGSGRLVQGLVSESRLRIVAIDPDAMKVAALREKLDAAGVYGVRASVHAGDPMDFGLPPYIASLIVSGDPRVLGKGLSDNVTRSLRPYGGVLCLPSSAEAAAAAVKLANARIAKAGDVVLLKREGALPGADDWSHETADPGNTRCSADELVKAPFGVVWFAGPAEERSRYYENHRTHGAVPQVVAGRLLLEGPRLISAFDVYTGRLLWEWRPGAEDQEAWSYVTRKWPDVHWMFEPMEGRMASSADAVYVVSDSRLHALDAAGGRPLAGFRFAERADWGSPKIVGDTLYLPSGKGVLALHRHTGKVRWRRSELGGTLAVGGGKVFCLEQRWPDRWGSGHIGPEGRWVKGIENWQAIKRRGIEGQTMPKQKLIALDAETGRPVWSVVMAGGRVSRRIVYSPRHDIVMVTGRNKLYRGRDGAFIQKLNLAGTAWVYGDYLLGGGMRGGLALFHKVTTGKPNEWFHALTGKPELWKPGWSWRPSKGCGPVVAGRHVVTFRSSFAAYMDVRGEFGRGSGVVNLGGFRTGCYSSIMPANGLLVSTNSGSGGCECAYPISTALAMVHMPGMEMWGSYGSRPPKGAIQRIGLNFGAPGDRLAENGTLWLDYPSVGGPSPELAVKTTPPSPLWFRHHSSRVTEGDGLKWVQASGARDLTSVTIPLNSGKPGKYTVRVYYAEPTAPDRRKLRGSVEEKRGVKAGPELTWTFAGGKRVCGIQVVAEDAAGN